MPVKRSRDGYVIDFDMKNIPIDDIYNKIPKVDFKAPQDIYNKLLIDKPNTYTPDKMVQCRVLRSYTDIQFGERLIKGNLLPSKITISRAEELMNNPRGALIEICKE